MTTCLSPLQAQRNEPNLGAGIIERLIAPKTRLEAFREVQIAKQNEDPHHDWSELPMAAFELYHRNIRVTECPQLDDAPPLYLASYQSDRETFSRHFSKSRYSRSEGFAPVVEANKPAHVVQSVDNFLSWRPSTKNPDLSVPPEGKLDDRVIVFLTHEGQVTWPFQGDNMTEGDVIKDLNGDGRYERVYSSNFQVYDKRKGEPDIWVQALRIEAVTPDSERLFYILLNWQNRNSEICPSWGWAVRDLDSDGVDEIVIGPITGEGAAPEATVVYRWDSEEQRYVGPKGNYDTHYLLLDPKLTLWDELRRVKTAGGLRYEALAMANSVDAPEEDSAAEAPYDWRQRKPYRHHSQAGSTNEALLKFMCGWSPMVAASPNDTHVAAVPSNSRFKFQSDWSALTPKDAIFTFVDSNQSDTHRNKYTLYYPINQTEPPAVDWIVLSSLNGSGVEVIQTAGEGTGRSTSAQFTRSLPERYPSGDYRWVWQSGQMDADRVGWFREALWWLAQLRSEAKVREKGYSSSMSISTNCFPSHMETAPPGVRLLQDGAPAALDIKAERAESHTSSWRKEFGPKQYLGFASSLFSDLKLTLLTEKQQKVTIAEVFAASPNFTADVHSGRLPPQLVQAMIRSAGDSGDAELLPILKEIETLRPALTEKELQWQQLKSELEALPKDFDVETYKRKNKLESQMASIEQAIRDNLWPWLHEPLQFAIRQLEVANDSEALAVWAAQPGELGALWALTRLKEHDAAAWQQTLTQVFLENSEWRKRIIRYLAYKDAALANNLVAQLPRPEQLHVIPSTVGPTKPAEMSESSVNDLLDTIQADDLEASVRLDALRKLTPRSDPHSVESSEVDQVLSEVLHQEMEPYKDPWPERHLTYNTALALLLRDRNPLPVKLYTTGAEACHNQFSYGSYLGLVIHLAAVKQSPEAQEWLLAWAHDFIEKDAGAWSRFTETVFTIDLNQFSPLLARLATFTPDALEGGSGLGKGRTPELKHGERYHLPRQVIAIWEEPDALTRAKCLMLLVFSIGNQFEVKGLYNPKTHIKENLTEQVEKLSAADKVAFAEFVQWCQRSINPADMGHRNRNYFDWLEKTFDGVSYQ